MRGVCARAEPGTAREDAMISLKRYLDSQPRDSRETVELVEGDLLPAVVDAYGSALLEMGHASLDACPGMGDELKRHLGEFKLGLSAGMATATFEPTAVANTWSYSVALPAADYANGVSTAITGTMQFDASGNLTTVTPTIGAAGTVGTAPGDVQSIGLNFKDRKSGVEGKRVDLR